LSDGNDHREPHDIPPPDDSPAGIGGIFAGLGAIFAVIKASKPILIFLKFVGVGLKWLLLFVKGGAIAIKASLIGVLALGAVLAEGGYIERAVLYAGHYGRAIEEVAWPFRQAEKLSKDMTVFAVMPDTTEEFAKVFARDASSRDINQILKAKYELEELAPKISNPKISREIIFVAKPNDGIASLKALIADPNRNVLSIIGHNNSGRFVFPNGESVELSELARMCSTSSKHCIFVSCKSNLFLGNQVGVARDITPSEAVLITKAISRRLDTIAYNPKDGEAFASDVREVVLYNSNLLEIKAQVKVITYTSGAVAISGAVLVELKE
jgi:hypothetical protein